MTRSVGVGCCSSGLTITKAFEKFNPQAIELKPDYADAYFNIGRTYILLGDNDKACEYYKLAQQYGRPNLEDYLRRCN